MASSKPAIAGTIRDWQEGRAKSVTFIVTEDCQLRCRYCYLPTKTKNRRMDFAIATATVDYLLREREQFNDTSIVFDFIGGEPLLEIELIDRICDYAKLAMYRSGHPWFDSYRFSFATNGLLYGKSAVQHFIAKNRSHLSIGFSIDGTRQKHDAQRVFPNGRGSYEAVVKNVPLWLAQFPGAVTKATISHDDLPYVTESVLHLFSLGIKNIAMNVVFEDVWKEGDDEAFEAQLVKLADRLIDTGLYRDHICSLFTRDIGAPIASGEDQNWCGTGRMLAIDTDGQFYACNRFSPAALQHKPPLPIGNCYDGLDANKLRPFLALTRSAVSDETCLSCEVASGCAWCSGCNYDLSEHSSLYERAVFICKMHKARVRANRYFWGKIDRLHPAERKGV